MRHRTSNTNTRRSAIRREKNLQNQREILSSTIDLDNLMAEPKVIRDLILELPHCSNARAAEIALQLQKLVRGEDSILEDDNQAEDISKVRAEMARVDAIEKKWEQDQEKFVDDIIDRANKRKPTGDKLARARAIAGKKLSAALSDAQANKASSDLIIYSRLQNDPKILTHFEGIPEQVSINGTIETRFRPVIIGLGKYRFTYPTGDHLVPKIIADRYNEILLEAEELKARERVLKLEAGTNAYKLADMTNQINTKYKSPSVLPSLA